MGAAPANYFNWHWLNDTIVSSGTVLDQNFDPVNAGIVEVVWPRYSPDNLQQYERQTFFDKVPLDSQGTYEIRQTPSSVLTNLGTYTQGNGVRSGRLHVTGGESGPIPNSLNALLFVEIERMLFAREVENLNIGIVDQEAYNAWSTVGLNSVIAQGNGSIGASLSAKARDVVSVSGESHFQAGSEVHLWTEPTYMDCGSNAYHMMQSSGSMSTLSESAGLIDKQRTIVLGFEMPEIEVRQDGNSAVMLNPIVPMIQYMAGCFSLQAGDVIQKVNGKSVDSVDAIVAALEQDRSKLEVQVQRGAGSYTGSLSGK